MSYDIFIKNYNFFWVFYGYSDFKTCQMIKIAFNKQIIDRCDSKIDFRGLTQRLSVFAIFIGFEIEITGRILKKRLIFSKNIIETIRLSYHFLKTWVPSTELSFCKN